MVSMPVRAFLDSDPQGNLWQTLCLQPFQCPSGHFLIQTLARRDEIIARLKVSMPVRAFLDSDDEEAYFTLENIRFNARQGIS